MRFLKQKMPLLRRKEQNLKLKLLHCYMPPQNSEYLHLCQFPQENHFMFKVNAEQDIVSTIGIDIWIDNSTICNKVTHLNFFTIKMQKTEKSTAVPIPAAVGMMMWL